MPQISAEASTIRREVPITGETRRLETRDALGIAILDVLDAAIAYGGTTDLRKAILTVVYSDEKQAFEIRWDIAK